MLCHICLSAERLAEHISGRVIRAESLRYRPFHHRPDTLPHPSGRLRFLVPHGRYNRQSIRRRDGMDELAAQPREGVLTKRRFPLSGVLGTVGT